MFCARCGRENDADAAFCKYCGAPMAGGTPEKPKKKRTGLLLGLLVPLAAVVIALVTFFLLIYPKAAEKRANEAQEGAGEAAADRSEDESEDKGVEVSLQDVLLAESVKLAKLAGTAAGSDAFVVGAAQLPDEVVPYARDFAALSEPTDAFVYLDAAALARELGMSGEETLTGEPDEEMRAFVEQTLPGALGSFLNGQYGGSYLLAAAGAMTVRETVKLPESLEQAALVVLRCGSGEDGDLGAAVCFTPAEGALTSVSCVPLGASVMEALARDGHFDEADAGAVELAVACALTADVSLRAAAASAAADEAWCRAQALASLAGAKDADESWVALYTSDPEMTALVAEMLRGTADEVVSCEVFALERGRLLDTLDGETADWLERDGLGDYFDRDGLGEYVERMLAATLPTRFAAVYGVSALAANTIAVKLCSQTPYAAPLPQDFSGCRIVAMTWSDGVVTVTALYDGGNGIAQAQTAFLPSDEALDDLRQMMAELAA